MKKQISRIYLLALVLVFALPDSSIAQESDTNKANNFYGVEAIQKIELDIPYDNWAKMLDSLRSNGDGLLLANIKINGEELKNVGVRYAFSRSFKANSKRNSIYIKLNYISKDQNYQGNHSIYLSSALRDPSMVREVYGYELARKYTYAPQANYAEVTVNDAYFGLLVNVEPIEENFLNRNFGSSAGTLFKCEDTKQTVNVSGCLKGTYASLQKEANPACYFKNYRLLSENGWDDLIELTEILNDKPNKLDQVLDVDAALWMIALNNVIVNLSSYSGRESRNYYLYKKTDGKFVPILSDLNFAFGSFKNTGVGSDLDLKGLQELDPLLHMENELKPLCKSLLNNKTYKKKYLAYVRTIVYQHFYKGDFDSRIKVLQDKINLPLYKDKSRRYSHEQFKVSTNETIGKRSKIPGLSELMTKRGKYLKNYDLLRVLPPQMNDIKFADRAQFSNKDVDQFNLSVKVDNSVKKITIHYKWDPKEAFKSLSLKDDGKGIDKRSGDLKYSVSIPIVEGKNELSYYLEAENAVIMSFSPINYTHDLHKVSLAELNN